jgi:hypothetical protein
LPPSLLAKESASLATPLAAASTPAAEASDAGALFLLGVALQVEFERQILKPVFQLMGFRLWV